MWYRQSDEDADSAWSAERSAGRIVHVGPDPDDLYVTTTARDAWLVMWRLIGEWAAR